MIYCPKFKKDIEKCLPYRAMEDAQREINNFRKLLDNISVTVFRGCVDKVEANGKPISYTVKDLDH